jgi:uncharacterized protein (DUF1330 family)
MAAYLIADIERINDPSAYERYRSAVSPGLEAAGGRYFARGGAIDVLEGAWRPGRLVLVRFDSMETARDWWASPAYEPLRKLRQEATATNMIVVDGLQGAAR